jgi:hypothetical protein
LVAFPVVSKSITDMALLMALVPCVGSLEQLITYFYHVCSQSSCGVVLEQCLTLLETPPPLPIFFRLFPRFRSNTELRFGFFLRPRSRRSGTFATKSLWKIFSLTNQLTVCLKFLFSCSSGGLSSEIRT